MSKRRWFQETFKPIANDWNQGATISSIQSGSIESNEIGTNLQETIMKSVYPVGSVMIRYDDIKPSNLEGLTNTTWELLKSGNYIRSTTSESQLPGATGGTLKLSNLNTSSVGLATAITNTGSHTLTIDQIPSHRHMYNMTMPLDEWTSQGWIGIDTNPKVISVNDRGKNRIMSIINTEHDALKIRETGGGKSHSHTIPSISLGTHSHTIPSLTIEPPFERLAFWKRIK